MNIRNIIFACCIIAALASFVVFAQQKVDTVVTNGKILTVDSDFGVVQALAINDGRIVARGTTLPHLGLPIALGGTAPASWRYLTLTGILPAIPIALMLPFVPESQVWKRPRAQGTLKRPSFLALFSPQFRRATLVTAVLSACAYGIAFGALQLTPLRIAPGLPQLTDQSKALVPLRKEAAALFLETEHPGAIN